MDSRDVLAEMVANSGLSYRQVSLEMDREATYLKTIIYRGRRPRIDTFAKVADVCGYDLLVRRRSDGHEMSIDANDDD